MKNKLKKVESEKSDNYKHRRSFIKKLGMGIIATSAYTVISMTQFACKHEPIEPTFRGGY
jgi:hypothetical protein